MRVRRVRMIVRITDEGYKAYIEEVIKKFLSFLD